MVKRGEAPGKIDKLKKKKQQKSPGNLRTKNVMSGIFLKNH
jgi:hypothetical protein